MFFLTFRALKQKCFWLLLACVIIFHAAWSQNTSTCQTTHLILKNISKYHYNPPSFDAATRIEVLNLFVEEFDPYRLYFLNADVKPLEAILRADGDDVFCKVIEKGAEIYRQRALQMDSFITAYLQSPLVFSNTDTIYYSPGEKRIRSDNLQEQRQLVKNRL
jgi:hypothetical protein